MRPRISLLSRSCGLLDQIWRQICFGKAVSAGSPFVLRRDVR